MIRIDAGTFEPAVFSHAELRFLLDHLEEPANAALSGNLPAGVNPNQIGDALDEFQSYEQMRQFRNVEWAGFEAVKDSILRFLAWEETRARIQAVSGGPSSPNFISQPSQYAWDDNGASYKSAVGADSTEMARTEILDDGSRKPFGVKLRRVAGTSLFKLGDVAPWVKSADGKAYQKADAIVVDTEGKNGSLTCSICKHAEAFKTDSRQAKNLARSRMARHLKGSNDDVARHRLLYRKEYESPTARV